MVEWTKAFGFITCTLVILATPIYWRLTRHRPAAHAAGLAVATVAFALMWLWRDSEQTCTGIGLLVLAAPVYLCYGLAAFTGWVRNTSLGDWARANGLRLITVVKTDPASSDPKELAADYRITVRDRSTGAIRLGWLITGEKQGMMRSERQFVVLWDDEPGSSHLLKRPHLHPAGPRGSPGPAVAPSGEAAAVTLSHLSPQEPPEALRQRLQRLYAELESAVTPPSSAPASVAVTWKEEWRLTANERGTLTWENLFGNAPPRHQAHVDKSKVLDLWERLSTGDLAAIEAEPWQPGQAPPISPTR